MFEHTHHGLLRSTSAVGRIGHPCIFSGKAMLPAQLSFNHKARLLAYHSPDATHLIILAKPNNPAGTPQSDADAIISMDRPETQHFYHDCGIVTDLVMSSFGANPLSHRILSNFGIEALAALRLAGDIPLLTRLLPARVPYRLRLSPDLVTLQLALFQGTPQSTP